MNFPKITVVTASFNQGIYLEDTILSIIGQNYPNLEYIIIDGGSTDESVKIISKYQHKLAYWVSEKDNGVCDAINKGFGISTGEIMCCINSDDMLHPRSLFVVAEIFSKFPQVQWLLGASTIYDEKGRTVFVKQSKRFSLYHYLLGEFDWIQLESTFWRRSIWKKAGGLFDPQLKLASDFDLWIRFFQHSQLHVVNALLGGFRSRSKGQLSVDGSGIYHEEIQTVLSRQLWDKSVSKNLNRLKNLRKGLTLLKKSRIFAHSSLLFRINAKIEALMAVPELIEFDRKSQSFFLDK